MLSRQTIKRELAAFCGIAAISIFISLFVAHLTTPKPASAIGVSGDTGVFFMAPLQGYVPQNSEATSSANAAVTTTIAPATQSQVAPFGRVALFSASGRCSAGSAQLQIKDGSTVIWSTAATQIGTTQTTFDWPDGLVMAGGDSLNVVLGTCGSSNTGTLDVQATQF